VNSYSAAGDIPGVVEGPEPVSRIAGFLQAQEPYCVAAAARFLQWDPRQDQIWSWYAEHERLAAVIILSKGTLFPVFAGMQAIPLRDFAAQGLRDLPIRAIQGIRRDVALLEDALAWGGTFPTGGSDYDLMTLDQEPVPVEIPRPLRLPGLILRYPDPADTEALFHLQAAYELEEVVPQGGSFNPAVCRLSIDHILAHEYLLLAQWKSQILGKINTNAASFSRYQIGGVYVHPEYRRLGIASAMAAAFVQDLRAFGRGLSLFVKKENPAAREVYQRIGFERAADYRISYY
jgi:GNAT superfamily N-acetyltransferase